MMAIIETGILCVIGAVSAVCALAALSLPFFMLYAAWEEKKYGPIEDDDNEE